MKKLKLIVEELRVETFGPGADAADVGTVHAYYTMDVDAGCPTGVVGHCMDWLSSAEPHMCPDSETYDTCTYCNKQC